MTRWILCAACLLLAAAPARAALVIDDFGADLMLMGMPGFGQSIGGAVAGDMLGGERTVRVSATGFVPLPVQVFEGRCVGGGGHCLSFNSSGAFSGRFEVVWDGAGQGLGGIDLTQGGRLDRLRLTQSFADVVGTVTVTIADASVRESLEMPAPIVPVGDAEARLEFLFGRFQVVDLTQVVSVRLRYESAFVSPDVEWRGLAAVSAVPLPAPVLLLATALLLLPLRARRGADAGRG